MAGLERGACTWPGSRPEYSFESAVDDAIASRQPLVVDAGVTAELMAPIRLPRGAALEICASAPAPGSAPARPTISGCGHSIFIVGHGRLVLRDIALRHTLGEDAQAGRVPQEERRQGGHPADKLDKTSIGAALLGRDRARCELHGCEISSARGFAVWLVQRATASFPLIVHKG